MKFFSGRPPAGLGVRDGRLAPPPRTPNGVASEPPAGSHAIAALRFTGDADAAFARLRRIVESLPRARVVTVRDDYLHAEFRSRCLGFVDDAEFLLDRDAGKIQLRSAARLGYSDFGVNRARIEALRRRFAAGGG